VGGQIVVRVRKKLGEERKIWEERLADAWEVATVNFFGKSLGKFRGLYRKGGQ